MKNFLTIIAVFILLLGGVYISNKQNGQTLGSVTDGQVFTATTTYNNVGTATFGATKQLKSNAGVLGQVVITTAAAGTIRLQDATSTTDIASTSIATFPASAAAGTYIFNAAFGRGLIVETITGALPTVSIMYR